MGSNVSVCLQNELAEYYYHWKKTNPGLSSRNTRRQRKNAHIQLSKMMMKPREVTPEREYSECVEGEGEGRGGGGGGGGYKRMCE